MSPAQPLLVIPVFEARPLTYSSDNERVNPWSEGNPDRFIITQLSHYCCLHMFIHSSSIHLPGTYYMLGSLQGARDKVVRKVY